MHEIRDMERVARLRPQETKDCNPEQTGRQSPLRESLALQQERLSSLHETIGGLESRLQPVLADPHPVAGESDGKAGPRSEYLAAVSAANDSIYEAIARIRAIIERLEV